MTFSRANSIKKAQVTKVRRAITMAKSAGNPDFNIRFPDFVREAVKGNFTVLKTKVLDDILKRQDIAMKRRLKRVGK